MENDADLNNYHFGEQVHLQKNEFVPQNQRRKIRNSNIRKEPVSFDKGGSFRFALSLREEECLYGLGEDNDVSGGSLNRRGSRRDMVTGQRINRNHVTADFPVPFLLSLGRKQPYAIYVDNTYRLDVDLGKTKHDYLRALQRGADRFYESGYGKMD
ncbi:MAG: hypothetical protein LUD16_00045 [Lachnospiraceae bacterium]|nr:hypothetical protein [Lachnospiraceae bacterium]